MDKNFPKSLKWLAEHEGGLTCLKDDPGGLTNLGVTQADYNHYRRFKQLPIQSVRLITEAEREDDFRTFYWNTLQCSKLPSGIDNAIFDMAVNNGATGAARCAQRIANQLLGKGLLVDGHIGPQSLDIIDDCHPAEFIDAFCDLRLKIDSGFANWKTFARAWTNRVNGNKKLRIGSVRDQSKSLIDAVVPVKPFLPAKPAPANLRRQLMNAFALLIAKIFHRK